MWEQQEYHGYQAPMAEYFICAPLPRKGIQEILYPDAPGVFLQDTVKELTPMSTTFTSLTAWISWESETAAEK